MVDILQSIGDRIVAVILATTALMSGLLAATQTIVAPREEVALIYRTATSSTQEFTAITPIAAPLTGTTTAPLTPGLLPVVALLPPKKATTTKAKAAAKQKTPAVEAPTVEEPTVAVPTSTVATSTAATPTITAQWLLDNTKLSFKQKRDGTYNAVFTANADGHDFTWSARDAFIGEGAAQESAAIPKFAFSFSCNPMLEAPPPGSLDQSPFLKVRTSYDCTIGFAATGGNDQKMRSKNLHFETGAGQLVVTTPSSMGTLLVNGINNGGFVFANQDAKPVTVTKLTLDVSYTGLSTLNSPLIMRVLDPSSGASLFDYHMEKFTADSSTSYTYAAAGIEVPLNFTLKPTSQKLLPIQVLGVSRLSISGVDPKVAITLRALTIDAGDVPIVLTTPQIRWSCVVALTAYSPNATSGPFATGEACR